MMAGHKSKAVLVILYLCVACLLCMLTSRTEAQVARVKRQECQYGTYEHEGRTCCRCNAGQKVKEHCTALSKRSVKCELCKEGVEFQSHPTQETKCEPCSPCTHADANVEVDTKCNAYHDTKCKCKANHYSPTGETLVLKICEPCRECPEGVKVACNATSNTICNDKSQDKSVDIAVGVTIPLLLVAGVVAAYFFWKKRKSGGKSIENGHVEAPEASIPLQPTADNLDKLGRHIPAIAEEIGWTAMKNLAIQSGIPNGRIESCRADGADGVESTIALLRVWEEKEGKDASTKLIQSLRQNHQNNTAEKVKELLSRGGS